MLEPARALEQTAHFRQQYRKRVVVEHRIARLVQPGIPQSRFRGRKRTGLPASDGRHGGEPDARSGRAGREGSFPSPPKPSGAGFGRRGASGASGGQSHCRPPPDPPAHLDALRGSHSPAETAKRRVLGQISSVVRCRRADGAHLRAPVGCGAGILACETRPIPRVAGKEACATSNPTRRTPVNACRVTRLRTRPTNGGF